MRHVERERESEGCSVGRERTNILLAEKALSSAVVATTKDVYAQQIVLWNHVVLVPEYSL